MKKAILPLLLGVAGWLIETAFAATPIPTLIVDGQNNHDWRHTTPALKKILEDTGLFQVDVVTTPPRGGDFSTFKPVFKKYRVVVSNFNANDKWPEDVSTAFEEYVRGGVSFLIETVKV